MSSINDLATAAIASSSGPAGAAAAAAGNQQQQQQGSGETAPAAAAGVASSSGNEDVVRGALIVLEGLDRSGKTTQVKLLEQRFVELGRRVKTMRFPDRTTPIGQMIDAYLKSQVEMDDHVIHLLFSANRWEAAKSITALLAAGTTIICDRYYYSGIVYSASKQNPSLSLAWARGPEVGLPRPDLVLFLDLDEAQARSRGGWGGEVYEHAETQRRVKDLFWGLSLGSIIVPAAAAAAAAPPPLAAAPPAGETAGVVGVVPTTPGEGAVEETHFRQEEEDLHVIDASPSVEDVAEEIWHVVGPRVESVERGEVGRVVRRVS